jgi:hypothetical protein
VIPVDNDQGIEQHRFEFVTIAALQQIAPGEFCDVMGVVTDIAPISSINTKAGAQLNKRAITVMDKTMCKVCRTK